MAHGGRFVADRSTMTSRILRTAKAAGIVMMLGACSSAPAEWADGHPTAESEQSAQTDELPEPENIDKPDEGEAASMLPTSKLSSPLTASERLMPLTVPPATPESRSLATVADVARGNGSAAHDSDAIVESVPSTIESAPPAVESEGAPAVSLEPSDPGGDNAESAAGVDVRTVTYSVEVESGLSTSQAEAAVEIQRVLNDPRGWSSESEVAFVQVAQGEGAVQIMVASPATTDRLCRPLNTAGWLSCRNGNRILLNHDRWTGAVRHWTADVAEYRAYLVNHEMGHMLGHGHTGCPGDGELAPVMMQQTKSLRGCVPNGWVTP